METRPAETLANIAICLIHQTNYLLDQLIRRLEQNFVGQAAEEHTLGRQQAERRREFEWGGAATPPYHNLIR